MEKGYKGRHRNISFMMKGKTLATVGALTALGLAVYAQSTLPTIGQLAQQMETNPSAWTVVVGANAKASDVVGASNIIAALETFTSVPTNSSVNTSSLQVTLQGVSTQIQNSYPLYTQGSPLYLGSAPTATAIQVGSGSFTVTVNGQSTTYNYQAYVYPTTNYQLKFIQTSTSSNNYSPNVAFVSSTQATAFNLTIYFSPALNVTALQQSPQQITIFNTSYYLVYNANNGQLQLVPSAQTVTLSVGQSITFNGVSIALENILTQYGSSSTAYAVLLNVNGQSETVNIGSQINVDGINILVLSAYSSVLNTSTGYAELVISTQGYYFDVNSNSVGPAIFTSSGSQVQNVQVSGSISDYQLSSLTFSFTLPQINSTSYYGLVNGQTYTLPIFNYELVFPQVQLPAQGSQQITVTQSGSPATSYSISFTDALSGTGYTLNLYNVSGVLYPFTSSTSQVYVGQVVPGGSITSVTLNQYDYFAVYNPNLNQTEILQLTNIGQNSAGSAYATFTDVISGQQYTVYNGTPLIVDGGISLNVLVNTTSNTVTLSVPNGATYGFSSNSSLILAAPGNTLIELSGLYSNTTTVSIVKSYTGYTVSPTNIQFNITSTGLSVPTSNYVPATSTEYEYLDEAGAMVIYNNPTGGTPSLSIYVPSTPVSYPIALAPVGASATTQTITVGVGQTIPGTQYTVEGVSGVSVTGYTQPTALIGKVILDTQAPASLNNVVVVGGPAVNTLAASAIIQWVSEKNSTLAMQLQNLTNSQGGYIYGSQLAPVLQQLNISFGPGTSLIFVGGQYTNELVIFGWSGNDTTEATELFANYLVHGIDAQELNNATMVVLNDQQLTANNLPSIEEVQ